MKITRGRIVTFVHPQTAEELAALVVRVLDPEVGLVHLIAFNDVEEALYGIPAHTVRRPGVNIEGYAAAYHEEGLPGHWHWPVIEPEQDETDETDEGTDAGDEGHQGDAGDDDGTDDTPDTTTTTEETQADEQQEAPARSRSRRARK